MEKAAKVVGELRRAEETKVAVVQADTPGSSCEAHHLLDGLCLLRVQDSERCLPEPY